MPRARHPGATAEARRLIKQLNIRNPQEIDIELIAGHLGMLVRPLPLQHEEGRLIRGQALGIINVATHAYASQKWRFVVAHEIGHFLRHPDNDNFEACTSGDLSNYSGTGRETEANEFAAELLMPEVLFAKRCDKNRPSLHDVGELAEEFSTSLTSTALRFVRYAPEPCAVVFSTEGVVDWVDWSPNFQLPIRKGARLDTMSYAGDLHAGGPVADRLSQVDGEGWSDSPRASDVDLFEHSRRVGVNTVLTLLWHRD